MTLLSPLALLFGLSALVPMILHLYQRRRRTVVEFSTNRFFTRAILRSQRRLQLRRLLLLILRVATCLLLALALARPIMSLLASGRPGNRDLVLVLDDSLSMQATSDPTAAEPTPTFDRARQTAANILADLHAGDRAAVVTFTGRTLSESTTPANLKFTSDVADLASRIQQLRPTAAAGDACAALAQAAALFDEPGPRDRCVLVLSDLQESDWRLGDWPQPPHDVPIALVSLRPALADNVAIEDVRLSQGTAVVGQPNLLRVRLTNYRAQTTPVELAVYLDDHEYIRRPLELPGSSPHVERVPLVFRTAGEHRLRVVAGVQDALAADNTLFATVDVQPQIGVLLVDGQADVDARQSAAFYLQAALQAVGSDGDTDTTSSVLVDKVRPEDLAGVTLDGYRVIVLCAVRALAPRDVERLTQFVRSGGGLAIFLGPNADTDFYNNTLGGGPGGTLATTQPAVTQNGLLPAAVRGLLDTTGGSGPLHLVQADVEHPMLQRFKGTLRSALAGIDVYRAYALVPEGAWTLATLERDLPLFVERGFGQGRVLLCATSPHPSWTNLPLRRAFLPLVNRMVSYLAGGGTEAEEHVVGEPLVLLRGGWDVHQPVYVRRPDGVRRPATTAVVGAEPRAVLEPADVTVPGFYELEGTGRVFAVNVPRRESVPYTLDLDAAQRFAGRWRIEPVEAAQKPSEVLAALLAGGAGGRGLWDTLLWAVLVLALLEPLIANQLRGTPTTKAAVNRKAA